MPSGQTAAYNTHHLLDKKRCNILHESGASALFTS